MPPQTQTAADSTLIVRGSPVLRSTRSGFALNIVSQCQTSPDARPDFENLSNEPINPDSSSRDNNNPRGFSCNSGASASTVVSDTLNRVGFGASPMSGSSLSSSEASRACPIAGDGVQPPRLVRDVGPAPARADDRLPVRPSEHTTSPATMPESSSSRISRRPPSR